MEKKRLILLILKLGVILSVVVAGWLYFWNPLEKIYNTFPRNLMWPLAVMIFGINTSLFRKREKQLISSLSVIFILIILYFIM